MTWVRKDDQMPINRKVAPLSDAAYRLDDEAICWASRNGTDGRIAADELDAVSKRGIVKNADELVRRGRWHRAEDPPCPSETCAEAGPDGWVIHDYLDFNPSSQQVKADKKAKAERQKRWRDARRGGRASRDATRDALRDTSHDALRDGGVDASRNAPGDAAPRARVSRPVPSRPEGSGTGGARPEQAPAARLAAAGRADGGREEDHNQANGRAAAPPPDLSGLRATLATARSKAARATRGPNGAFDELRAATPDVAPLAELLGELTAEPAQDAP